MATPVPITLSVDVYAVESLSHPDRHFGFWNVDLADATRAKRISGLIDLSTKDGKVSLDGIPVGPQTARVRAGVWKGPFALGRLKGGIAAFRTNDPGHIQGWDFFVVEQKARGFVEFNPPAVKGAF